MDRWKTPHFQGIAIQVLLLNIDDLQVGGTAVKLSKPKKDTFALGGSATTQVDQIIATWGSWFFMNLVDVFFLIFVMTRQASLPRRDHDGSDGDRLELHNITMI